MRIRLIVAAAVAAVVAGLTLPGVAAPPPAPPSCVYLYFSEGFHIQLGSAPNGPESCLRVP